MKSLKKIVVVLLIFISSMNYVDAKEVKFTRKLKKGSIGTSVEQLQKRLNEVMDCDLEVNGEYDDETYSCVVEFQDEYNLTTDGIVGKKTHNKLYSSKLDSEEETKKFDKLITIGSTGTTVENIQEKLNDVMECNLKVDGIFGEDTYNCVLDFQKKYNLKKIDGIVGSETYEMLFGSQTDEIMNEEENTNELDDTLENNLGPLKLIGNKNIIITKDNSSVRSGASEENQTLYDATLGEIFQYVSIKDSEDRQWYKVKLNKGYKYSYGYIKAKDAKKNFIVVDVSEQKLIYYKTGKIILETNVITKTEDSDKLSGGTYTLKKSSKNDMEVLKIEDSDGGYQYIGMNSKDATKIYNALNNSVKVIVRG